MKARQMRIGGMAARIVVVTLGCWSGWFADAARAVEWLSLEPGHRDSAGAAGASDYDIRVATADAGKTTLTLEPAWTDSGSKERGLEEQRGPSTTTLDIAPAPQQNIPSNPEGPANKLELTIELPIWLPGINGTAGVRGFTAPVNASFTDILQATDSLVGLGLRVEADYGPWIFAADGLYMKLAKDDIRVGPASIEFLATMTLADADILYRFGNWNLGSGGGDPTLGAAAGVGGRYMHVGLSLNTANGLSRSQNQDWADPVAAGQLTLDLDKHWQILARGDIGGGGGADLTWSAGTFVGYQFALSSSVSAALKLGYEALGEDYHHGSGADQFDWDVIMHGPMLVLAIKF